MSNPLDTYDNLINRIDWAYAMALQVGSEHFGGWNEEIGLGYANAMANYLLEAKALARELDDHWRSKS